MITDSDSFYSISFACLSNRNSPFVYGFRIGPDSYCMGIIFIVVVYFRSILLNGMFCVFCFLHRGHSTISSGVDFGSMRVGAASHGHSIVSYGMGLFTNSCRALPISNGFCTKGNGLFIRCFRVGTYGNRVVSGGFGIGIRYGVSVGGVCHAHADASVSCGGDLSSDGDAAAFGPCSYFHSLGYFGGVVFPDGNGATHVVPCYVIACS